MNERIRELMQDSPIPVGYIGNWGRVRWNENVYPQLGDDLYAGVDLQKFAELIVRECAEVIRGNEIDHPITGAVYDGDQAKAIKEHFGVEE